MPKVTVYMPTHNYGHYLDQAIGSVLKQTMIDWELLIIDDGSTDNTQEVLKKYEGHSSMTIVRQENKGLNVSNNVAIRLARGQYVMRLDADDYLDENCLLVLSNVLDQKPEIGLVFPDYHHVDEEGEILETIRRKKIGEEVELLDLPAHGACSMTRKEILLNLGTYNEEFSCQDGYDLWLRLIQQYRPYNVNIPLFYYRQHPKSLTQKQKEIYDTRGKIKRLFIDKYSRISQPHVLGVIPVLSASIYSQNRPFVPLMGKPLIWYTLHQVSLASSLEKIIVATEDDETISYVQKNFPKISCFRRTGPLSSANSRNNELLTEILNNLDKRENYRPDAICTLYISTPLREAKHIDQAVDTMTIFELDTVVSIQEELNPCYHHEKFGLTLINMSNGQTRLERKAIFKGNGAITLNKREVIFKGQNLGSRVGHVTMLPEESVKINTDFEFWLAEKIIEERQKNLR